MAETAMQTFKRGEKNSFERTVPFERDDFTIDADGRHRFDTLLEYLGVPNPQKINSATFHMKILDIDY